MAIVSATAVSAASSPSAAMLGGGAWRGAADPVGYEMLELHPQLEVMSRAGQGRGHVGGVGWGHTRGCEGGACSFDLA